MSTNYDIGLIFVIIIIAVLVFGLVFILKRAGIIVSQESVKGLIRRCLVCGYEGAMMRWTAYNLPRFIIVIGLVFYIIPGFIFWAWAREKYKCPKCGSLSKSISIVTTDTSNSLKKCPYCAEIIKNEAIKCRFCGSEIS